MYMYNVYNKNICNSTETPNEKNFLKKIFDSLSFYLSCFKCSTILLKYI